MNEGNAKKNVSWKKVILIVVCVLLALFLLAMLGAVIYIEGKLNRINRVQLGSEETYPATEWVDETDAIEPDNTAPTMDPSEVTWPSEPEPTIGAENHVVNILLVGQDRLPGQGRQRSDVMLLCTFDKSSNTLTMTSFLRDLYVQIPGYLDNRLNVAYPRGGFALLDEALELNFGVHVDANVEVDFGGFTDIINLLGGVDIELTGAEADYLNLIKNWDPEGLTTPVLSKGLNHLNGDQALAYSRIRYLDSDFGRTNRQRKVMSALIEKLRGKNLLELNSLLDQILPLITTDMSNADIAKYVIELFPMLADCTVNTQYIPAKGTYQGVYIRGMAVLLPDIEANRQLLLETIGG